MSPNEATTNTNVTPTLPNEARPAKPASFIITVILSIVLILTVSATILIIVNAIKSYNNPPAPDQARVKSYCISHGLQYTLVENGGALGDFADISKNLGGVSIKEVALCLQTATIDSPQDGISYSSIGSSPDPFIISVYFLNDSYKGPASSNLSSVITETVKLEDSESLFKGVDYYGHPFHSFDVSVKANLEEANKSINIVVHHNSTCNQTGELSAANASHFAVTYRKASGKGYICESNK